MIVRNVAIIVCHIYRLSKNCERLQNNQLFNETVSKSNSSHVLPSLMIPPPIASQHYNLRRRIHTLIHFPNISLIYLTVTRQR